MIINMENYVSRVFNALRKEDVQKDVPLSKLTSFKIGGNAALVYRPASDEALQNALSVLSDNDCPFHVLGNGTNVLAPDNGYDGLILRIDTPRAKTVISDGLVTADAGEHLSDLVSETLGANLMGLEPLCGIPGTVGGAIAMNAGAYGAEISEYLKSITVLMGGKIVKIDVRPSDFGLRRSRFTAPEAIVLSATFALPADDGTARQHMLDCTARRNARQPLSYPSAGSVFKRPAGYFAGGLIEQCSLKGERVGGAVVSMQHAGFIVNTGNATEKDVLVLIARIQERVRAATGVQLERELKRLCEV